MYVLLITGNTFQYTSAQQFNSTNESSVDLLTYQNSTFGIKIDYPKNWELEEYLDSPPAFFSPESKDYVKVSVDIQDYSNTKIDNIDKVLQDSMDTYTEDPESYPEFNLLSSTTNKSLGGLPAYMFEAEYEDSEVGKIMILETGILEDDINYYIEYVASPTQYDYYLPIVQTMVKSFEISK
jgi:hypothetical protein